MECAGPSLSPSCPACLVSLPLPLGRLHPLHHRSSSTTSLPDAALSPHSKLEHDNEAAGEIDPEAGTSGRSPRLGQPSPSMDPLLFRSWSSSANAAAVAAARRAVGDAPQAGWPPEPPSHSVRHLERESSGISVDVIEFENAKDAEAARSRLAYQVILFIAPSPLAPWLTLRWEKTDSHF